MTKWGWFVQISLETCGQNHIKYIFSIKSFINYFVKHTEIFFSTKFLFFVDLYPTFGRNLQIKLEKIYQ
jgi:hypothetical protein